MSDAEAILQYPLVNIMGKIVAREINVAGTRPLSSTNIIAIGTEKRTQSLAQSELYIGLYSAAIESKIQKTGKAMAIKMLFGDVT